MNVLKVEVIFFNKRANCWFRQTFSLENTEKKQKITVFITFTNAGASEKSVLINIIGKTTDGGNMIEINV